MSGNFYAVVGELFGNLCVSLDKRRKWAMEDQEPEVAEALREIIGAIEDAINKTCDDDEAQQ